MSKIVFEGKEPRVHESAFLAPGSWIVGDVTIGEGSNVWMGAVVRGDDDTVRIGARTTVLENCVVEAPTGFPVEIGDNSIISHGAVVHGAKIGDRVLVGIGAMVLDGAEVGDGSIVGWGWDDYGQATPPDRNDFVAIAAGGAHSLALKADGSIVGWGADRFGQATPPDGNHFVELATGGGHNLALRSDGSIIAWGDDSYGQASPPTGDDFTAVAAGTEHSLALKSHGSIVCWGRNDYGQATPPDGDDFVAIAAGYYHSLAIRQPCQYALAGDLNNDCRVNLYDFARMLENWLIDCRLDPSNPACTPK